MIARVLALFVCLVAVNAAPAGTSKNAFLEPKKNDALVSLKTDVAGSEEDVNAAAEDANDDTTDEDEEDVQDDGEDDGEDDAEDEAPALLEEDAEDDSKDDDEEDVQDDSEDDAEDETVPATVDKEHVSVPAQIKHAVAEQAAKLRRLQQKQRSLQADASHLEKIHSKLQSSVHATQDKAIAKAQERLNKKQAVYQKEEANTKYWENQLEKIKKETDQAMQDEKVAAKALQQAKFQRSQAKQLESAAEAKATHDKHEANEEVASLESAKRKAAKEEAKLGAAESKAKEVEQKNKGKSGMRAVEELDDAQRAVQTEKDELENLNSDVASIGAQASEVVKEEKTSHVHLLEVQAQAVSAEKQQALAEKQYNMKKALVAKDFTSLKYVKTKYAGEESKLKLAEAATRSAEESVRKSLAIREKEEQKVKQHLEKGKAKIKTRMQKGEASRAEMARGLEGLKKQMAH